MWGDIFFRNVINAPLSDDQCIFSNRTFAAAFARLYRESTFLGVRKHLLTQDTTETDLDSADLTTDYDWTESSPPWIWNRTSFWAPRATITDTRLTRSSLLGVCSDVSGGSLLNPLAAGTGNIDTSVSTTCTATQVPDEGCPQNFLGTQVALPPWHHYRMMSRKHIRMARDQNLVLHIDPRLPSYFDGQDSWNCMDGGAFNWQGGVNSLVTFEAYVRIGATIRLH